MSSNSTQVGSNIFIKQVTCIADIEIMHEWMRKQFLFNAINDVPEPETLVELYSNILGSDFVRSYIVWLTIRRPLFEMELCNAWMDEISSYYTVCPKSYTMRLQFPVHSQPSILFDGIRHCLRHIFKHLQASEIIVPVLSNHTILKKVLLKTGFTINRSVKYNSYRVYILHRLRFNGW